MDIEGFTSRRIGGTHAMVGGEGPPLLLLCGWPQTWYAWRELMPALARDFSVVVPDPRGVGLSDKPQDGYDTGTLATDMVDLMSALGHERFSMAGHDLGMWTGYALAADHPGRLDRLALVEAVIPGIVASPPLFMPQASVNRFYHFAFNRLDDVNERLVAGREEVFFGHQFATKAARPLAEHAVRHYIETLKDPEALHASFQFYRALDTTIAQNAERAKRRLTIPLLTIAGELSLGDAIADTMRGVADDVTSVVLPGCGHYPAEEDPAGTLEAFRRFFVQ
ncbi:alpha/beta fold hydrolase [Actinoplanes sp. NPDC051494]|uniref:alpha/beta fold hydrolase n=1 Tax=Actinoplanes sp. NPDC051494 TaxID=3363907 RepID=UPI00378D549F